MKMVTSLILSRLDYCSSLLSGLPASSVHSLRQGSIVIISTEATVKLVTSLILSRLDYCSSLLSGLPASSVHSRRREVS